MTTEHKHAGGIPTLTEIDAKIRAGIDSPEWENKSSIRRAITEAEWFASEMLSFDGLLARLPDGTGYDKKKAQALEDLRRTSIQIEFDLDVLDLEDVDYVYNNIRGEDPISALRKFADALDSASVAAPDYAVGLLRHARAIREILAKSEVAAQGAVRRAVTKERRWYMLWSAIAAGGLFFLWGRPLSFMVGLGFLLCVSVLAAWLKAGTTRTEVARRCAEIGWPLGK